jgi:hypothetical protein
MQRSKPTFTFVLVAALTPLPGADRHAAAATQQDKGCSKRMGQVTQQDKGCSKRIWQADADAGRACAFTNTSVDAHMKCMCVRRV